MVEPLEKLREQIAGLRQTSGDKRGKTFISPKALENLLTRDVIKNSIAHCEIDDYDQPSAVDRIFSKGKIVFGILISGRWENYIKNFIEHDTLDNQLPLSITQAEKVAAAFGRDFAQRAQWEFLPRILTKEMSGYHCQFQEEEILPFTRAEEIAKGNFSDVTKMFVEPSCQTIFPNKVHFSPYAYIFDADVLLDRSIHCEKATASFHR